MRDKNYFSKNSIRGYIVLGVIFAVFTIVAFAAPFVKTGTFVLAYIFAVVAIAFQVYVFRISFTKGEDAKSKFYGFPIARVGVTYLLAQLIVSLIEFFLSEHIPTWLALIIDVLPLAYAIIGCIAADMVRDEVERQDSQIKADVSNMRSLQSMSSALVGLCTDDALKNKVQNLADEFRYSDPVSSENTIILEQELEQQLTEIRKTLQDGDVAAVDLLCSKILAGLSERNRVCALDKRR